MLTSALVTLVKDLKIEISDKVYVKNTFCCLDILNAHLSR